MSYRIGVASTDGAEIDEHFGSARYWQIYDVDTSAHFVETRKTQAKCQGNCEGGFEHLLAALDDCDAIIVFKIGSTAAAFMLSRGKRVFEAYGDVEKVLERIIEGDFFRMTERCEHCGGYI